jgi:hypothetical protein
MLRPVKQPGARVGILAAKDVFVRGRRVSSKALPRIVSVGAQHAVPGADVWQRAAIRLVADLRCEEECRCASSALS